MHPRGLARVRTSSRCSAFGSPPAWARGTPRPLRCPSLWAGAHPCFPRGPRTAHAERRSLAPAVPPGTPPSLSRASLPSGAAGRIGGADSARPQFAGGLPVTFPFLSTRSCFYRAATRRGAAAGHSVTRSRLHLHSNAGPDQYLLTFGPESDRLWGLAWRATHLAPQSRPARLDLPGTRCRRSVSAGRPAPHKLLRYKHENE